MDIIDAFLIVYRYLNIVKPLELIGKKKNYFNFILRENEPFFTKVMRLSANVRVKSRRVLVQANLQRPGRKINDSSFGNREIKTSQIKSVYSH